MTLDEARDKKFLEIIITYLNKQKMQGARGVFDCGKLGFLLITRGEKWESEWFIPNTKFQEIEK